MRIVLEDDERQKETECGHQSGVYAQPLPVNPGDARFERGTGSVALSRTPFRQTPYQTMADVLYAHPGSVRNVVIAIDEVSHVFHLVWRAQTKTCYGEQSGEQNYTPEVVHYTGN